MRSKGAIGGRCCISSPEVITGVPWSIVNGSLLASEAPEMSIVPLALLSTDRGLTNAH